MHRRLLIVLLFLLFPAQLLGADFPVADSLVANFSWRDASGQSHSLAEYRGKPVLIHFWASWCLSCRDEMPELVAWQRAHPSVVLLPISLDTSVAPARNFLTSSKIEWPINLSDRAESGKLAVRALPTTLVINSAGNVVARLAGYQMWADPAFSQSVLAHFAPAGRQ